MPEIVLVVFWAIVLVTVALTSHVNHRRTLWLLVVLPPLGLIALWWVPFARHTEFYIWAPAILALYISLVSILIRLCDIAHKWRRSESDANRIRLIRLLRPTLVVLIMGSLLARERMACRAFGAYATELAYRVQETCNSNGACPPTLEDWTLVEENPTYAASEQTITRMGRRALVRYENLMPANQSRLTVAYGRFRFTALGGVERGLKISE